MFKQYMSFERAFVFCFVWTELARKLRFFATAKPQMIIQTGFVFVNAATLLANVYGFRVSQTVQQSLW